MSKKLYEAFGYVDDKFLDIAEKSVQCENPARHISLKRTISIALAAALCISILAVTAAAAGWIPGLFRYFKELYPQDEALFEAAAQANINAIPEEIEIPHLDLSKFTLLEQYFDSNTILIGYNFDVVLPEPVVDIKLDGELLEKIKNGTDITSISWSVYEDWHTEPDTANSRKYSLPENAAEMDRMLIGTLSEAEYQKAWSQLEAQGYVCIAVRDASIGDHILINGIDTVEAYMESNAYADRTEYTSELGNCIRLEPLPEDIRNQEEITVTVNIFSSVSYWYMDLAGNGKIYYDTNNRTTDQLSFVLNRVD